MRTRPRKGRWAAAALATTALGVAGCGSGSNYANQPRPPSPVGVSAAVSAKRLAVSPDSLGGGPIVLTIANLTSRSLEVHIEPVDTAGPGARSGPINPQGTAQLSLDVSQGTYHLRATGGSSATAQLHVGTQRPSAQNQLLLP
jgi:hypothetical protein